MSASDSVQGVTPAEERETVTLYFWQLMVWTCFCALFGFVMGVLFS